MVVPTLPFELFHLILTELRLSCGSIKDRQQNGTAVSHVCKRWHPLGTAIVWHRLVVSTSDDEAKLSAHLQRYPQLALHVRTIKIDSLGDDDLPPFSSDGDGRVAESTAFKVIFSLCTFTRAIEFKATWISLATVFENLATSAILSKITRMSIQTTDGLESFLRNFPQFRSLDNLVFDFRGWYDPTDFYYLPAPDTDTTKYPRLTSLNMSLIHPNHIVLDRSAFLRRFFDRCDFSDLSHLTITLAAADSAILQQIATFPSLHLFTVIGVQDPLSTFLTRTVFPLLPSFSSDLPQFCVQPHYTLFSRPVSRRLSFDEVQIGAVKFFNSNRNSEILRSIQMVGMQLVLEDGTEMPPLLESVDTGKLRKLNVRGLMAGSFEAELSVQGAMLFLYCQKEEGEGSHWVRVPRNLAPTAE
ncbi:hypothetical protein JCM11641_001391 [Rhodosporidiobolus odoratus]